MELPVDYNTTHYKVRKQVREEYIILQKGLCYHCSAPLTGSPCETVTEKYISTNLFPPNFFQWPVHLHHSHKTGLTIGAVHCYCNAVLWQYYGE